MNDIYYATDLGACNMQHNGVIFGLESWRVEDVRVL